jgi:hypothetical protein
MMEDNHKTKNVERWANVRLMEEEHLALDVIQNRLQTTRSRLLRKVIRELIGMGPDLLTQEWMAFEKLAYQLAAVGRNLNQLVRAVNSGKAAMTPEDRTLMEGVRDQVDLIKKEIISAIDRSCHRWVKDAGR